MELSYNFSKEIIRELKLADSALKKDNAYQAVRHFENARDDAETAVRELNKITKQGIGMKKLNISLETEKTRILVSKKAYEYAQGRLFQIMNQKLSDTKFYQYIYKRTKAMAKPDKLAAWFLALENENIHSQAKLVKEKLDKLVGDHWIDYNF